MLRQVLRWTLRGLTAGLYNTPRQQPVGAWLTC